MQFQTQEVEEVKLQYKKLGDMVPEKEQPNQHVKINTLNITYAMLWESNEQLLFATIAQVYLNAKFAMEIRFELRLAYSVSCGI